MASGLGFLKAMTLMLASLLPGSLYSPSPSSDFSPAPMPPDYSFGNDVTAAPLHVTGVKDYSVRVGGEGKLPGPEDLAYDAAGGWLYTGCDDGWIRRVSVPGGHIEDWVFVPHGRPLGVAFAPDGSLIVADARIGLLRVSPDKKVELLTDTAEGVKFGMADGVDVAANGIIYFTDASYKYTLDNHMNDILEARPHGRLLSFDPATGKTTVLVSDLYFGNGVAVSPDQSSVIYCETLMRRCNRYHITGEKNGTFEKFVDNLWGFTDNVRYDGEGRYWIALSGEKTPEWDLLLKYPFIRKLVYLASSFGSAIPALKNSGGISVTLDGKPVSMYTDPELSIASTWMKIGKYLYYGSLKTPYISWMEPEEFRV